ncbi:hypothetical protein [Brevibacillus brevis]|uniref:hypothetical protein n=1 Tax=Brevibacillus brevis TaxID=1393 RepID=UPI0007D8C069|nr:hypothetical protein [Brevibacillus brevis]
MIKIDTNVKPENMSNLYWDYLKGKIEEEDLTRDQFNQIALEKYSRYIERGGSQTFEEFYSDIEITGL